MKYGKARLIWIEVRKKYVKMWLGWVCFNKDNGLNLIDMKKITV
jgi:hypothetical protein